MPPAPERIVLRDRNGRATEATIDQVPALVDRGWRPESNAEHQSRMTEMLAQERAPGALASATIGLVRGATFGLSDIAARAGGGQDAARHLREAQQAHPYATLAGQIVGQLATGKAVGGIGATTTGGRIAAGAAEGAAVNTGGYVSDVALGNRDLSAEGFVGAMGEGALWGGTAGAAFEGLGRGVQRARSLFAKSDLTPAAAAAAERDAMAAIATIRDESSELADASRERMRSIRGELRAHPDAAAEMDGVAHAAARDVADRANPTAAISEATGTPPAEPAPDDLLAKLHATQAGLGEGRTLGDMSRRGTAVEDAVNEHVGRVHPEMNRLVTTERELGGARGQIDDLLGSWREKYPGGMVELDAMSPSARRNAMKEWARAFKPTTGEDEAVVQNVLAPKAERTYEWLGGGEGPIGRVSTAPQGVNEAAKTAAAGAARSGFHEGLAQGTNIATSGPELMARATYAGKRAAAQAADEVYTAGRQAGASVDDQIRAAIRAREPASVGDDNIHRSVDAIGRLERAHADAVEALGVHATPAQAQRAQAFRAVEDAHSASLADSYSKAIEALDRKPGLAGRAMGMLSKAGEAAEMLHALGVHVPSASDVPVIGPVLGMFLKAKLLKRVLGGGAVAAGGAEATIAAKAAALRDRVARGVEGALGVAQKGVAVAAPAAPTVATILGRRLFAPAGEPQKLPDDPFAARAAELVAAARPGAVEDAVRERVGANDGQLVDKIAAVQRRKLDFLRSRLPQPSSPASPVDKEAAWTPDKQRQADFARYVEAADNPAGVFDKLARGAMPSHEELETVRTVYPELWAEAQRLTIDKIASGKHDWPYATRVRMAVVFRLPLDASASPGFGEFAQRTYRPPAPTPPPSPTGSAKGGTVKIAESTGNRLDRVP